MRATADARHGLTGTIHLTVRAVPSLNLASVTYEITPTFALLG